MDDQLDQIVEHTGGAAEGREGQMTRPPTEETTETSFGEGEGEGSPGELGEDDDVATAPDPVAVEETATEWSAWHLDNDDSNCLAP